MYPMGSGCAAPCGRTPQEIAMDAREHHQSHGDDHAANGAAKDPVCGMTVDPAMTKHRTDVEGQTYYFCGAGCRQKFDAEPHKYLARSEQAAPKPALSAPGRGEVMWTCPMHPEIIRKGPGSCPICGMALEPMTPSATDEVNPDLADMTRRFWVGVALSIPLLAIVMAEHVSDHAFEGILSARALIWLQLILATPAVLWAGWPFFERGWASIVNRRLNRFTLIALGTGVAYAYSLVAALAPEIFPASFRGHDGQVALYFKAAAVIVTLVLLGQVLISEGVERMEDRRDGRHAAREEGLVAEGADNQERRVFPVPWSPRKRRYGNSLHAS